MLLDNLWYTRIEIFNNQIRYSSHYAKYCQDIEFFKNRFSIIKSYLVLSLMLLSFCLGVMLLLLFIYLSLVFFPYPSRFSSYTSNKRYILVSLGFSLSKFSLNYPVNYQSSLLSYSNIFIYNSWNLTQT